MCSQSRRFQFFTIEDTRGRPEGDQRETRHETRAGDQTHTHQRETRGRPLGDQRVESLQHQRETRERPEGDQRETRVCDQRLTRERDQRETRDSSRPERETRGERERESQVSHKNVCVSKYNSCFSLYETYLRGGVSNKPINMSP